MAGLMGNHSEIGLGTGLSYMAEGSQVCKNQAKLINIDRLGL